MGGNPIPNEKKGREEFMSFFIPGVGTGEMYKFLITAPDGRKLYKADPFANYAEKKARPQLPLPRIFPISSGQIPYGWRNVRERI